MPEQTTIEKNRPESEDILFGSLKKEGIDIIQGLSGNIWTDYNLHDPGVTILDQLCYALTDLIYRTEFDVEDYLTNTAGKIDFENLALYAPEQIFPCQAITVNDYRKAIFDSIPEIDNVWVSKDETGGVDGLFNIIVRLRGIPDIWNIEKLKEYVTGRIRETYSSIRNLCEDLKSVKILDNADYELYADIEIKGKRYAADTLAEIYLKCLKHIAPGISYHPYDKSLREEKSLEEIFTGPLTVHGYIDDQELTQRGRVNQYRRYYQGHKIDR